MIGFKVHRLRPLVLLIKVVLRWWVWRVGGLVTWWAEILEDKNFLSNTSFTTSLTQTGRDRSRISAEDCSLSSFIVIQNGTNSYQPTSKKLKRTHMRSTVTACHRLDLHTRTLFSCYLLRVSTKTQPFSGNPSSITYLIRTLFATPYLRSSAVLSGHAAYIGN